MPEKSISKSRYGWYILLSISALELVSLITLQLMGMPHFPLPWHVLDVLAYGFWWQPLLAFILVIGIGLALFGFMQGGIKRSLAIKVFLAIALFFAASTLSFVLFSFWTKQIVVIHPWSIFITLTHIPTGNHEWYQALSSLIGTYILTGGLVFLLLKNNLPNLAESHYASSHDIANANLYSEKGIIIGKAYGRILRDAGFEPALIVAPTGTGKTTTIAIPNLLTWEGSVVVNDLKGELYQLTAKYREEKLGQKCIYFSPSELTSIKHRYNPFAYVSHDKARRIKDLQQISEILFPYSNQPMGSETFYTGNVRSLFEILSIYLLDTTQSVTIPKVYQCYLQLDFIGWLENLVLNQEPNIDALFYQKADKFLSLHEKEQSGIMGDFEAHMSVFSDPIIQDSISDNDFDIRTIRQEKLSIFIHMPVSQKERLKPLLTLFWAQLLNVIVEETIGDMNSIDVMLLMDEFGNLGKIDQLKEGVTFLRGYRTKPVILLQNLAQLSHVYGESAKNNFLDAKIKVIYTLNNLNDARYFSESLGKKTIKIRQDSTNTGYQEGNSSVGQSTHYQTRALMTSDELMRMPDNKAIIFVAGSYPILTKKTYWFKERQWKHALSEYQ